MTEKEKAKAYDEVREKIALRFGSNVAEEIFSKFEMSEDERIMKEIMDFIDTKTIDSDERRNRWFSYLEKYKPISFTSLEDIKVKVSLMQYISELNQDVVHLHPGIETCNEWIAWLEKQGTSYTKRDVDDAYVEGMAFAKDELEKQKPAWSEDDNSIVESILYWLRSVLNKSCYPRYEHWLKSLKQRIGG